MKAIFTKNLEQDLYPQLTKKYKLQNFIYKILYKISPRLLHYVPRGPEFLLSYILAEEIKKEINNMIIETIIKTAKENKMTNN